VKHSSSFSSSPWRTLQQLAGWLISALEGQTKQKVLPMGAEDINIPGRIFTILKQYLGEHRDSSTLAGAFFRHQQGLTESVGKYTFNFHLLWVKTNAVQVGTLSKVMLQDTFAGGLNPVFLKRAIKWYIREIADVTFTDAARKALHWMKEDIFPDTTAEQLHAVPSHDSSTGWRHKLTH